MSAEWKWVLGWGAVAVVLIVILAWRFSNPRIIEYDGCEYVKRGYGLAHKGNCKYCKERNEAMYRMIVQEELRKEK